LIVQYSARRDGSAMSALLLADGLREAGWGTHVAFAAPGPMATVFEERGHAAEVVPHKNWLRTKRYTSVVRNARREMRTVPAMRGCLDRVRPDVVSENAGASAGGVWAARNAGVPVLGRRRDLFGGVGGELVVASRLRAAIRRVKAVWHDR